MAIFEHHDFWRCCNLKLENSKIKDEQMLSTKLQKLFSIFFVHALKLEITVLLSIRNQLEYNPSTNRLHPYKYKTYFLYHSTKPQLSSPTCYINHHGLMSLPQHYYKPAKSNCEILKVFLLAVWRGLLLCVCLLLMTAVNAGHSTMIVGVLLLI